jgi:hypothetical protein
MISIKSFTIGNFVKITAELLSAHKLMTLGFITHVCSAGLQFK